MHIIQTRMSCTVCLKSSCLLICFHSWSLDLSQTLIQTIQILKEEKNCSKTMEKPKKKSSEPCPGQLLLRFSLWVETVFLFFSRFLPLCQSNNVSCFFLFLGFLGESFTLTSIHWHSFHSTFYIGVFIELLWLLSHQRKCTVKTALSPTSLGTPLD